ILAAGANEPTAFGFDATGWVSIAMLALIAIVLWKKVPAMIAGSLDNKIAEISKQLTETEALRKDAEALKSEYEAKLASAEREVADIRSRASAEADGLIEKAKADATALIGRRQQMAEDRIAAAEAGALADVRSAA